MDDANMENVIANKVEMGAQPTALASDLVQYMINVLKFTLQTTVDFLKAVKMPDVSPLSPSAAMERVNQVIATVLNYAQLKIVGNSLTSYLKELSHNNYLPTIITSLLDYMINQVNTLSNRFQTFLPILLLKLYYTSHLVSMKHAQGLSAGLSSFSGSKRSDEEVSMLKAYIKQLVGTIEKEREQHRQDVSKLTTLEQEGVKTIENVRRVKRNFEESVQGLVQRLSDETVKHNEEVEQLRQSVLQERNHADAKIAQLKNEYELQKDELRDANIELALLNWQQKRDAKNRTLQQLSNCDLHSGQIEEIKREQEAHVANVTLERESHQKEVERLRKLIEEEKLKAEANIAMLTEEFATQRKNLLEKIDGLRSDWTERIEHLQTINTAEVSNTGIPITEANLILEAQKQELLEQMSKAREMHKQEIEQWTIKNRESEANANAKVEEVLRDFERVKEELQKNVDGKRDDIKEEIEKATEAQKAEFERERTQYSEQILGLQTTINKLQKKNKPTSKLFDSINKALTSSPKTSDKDKAEKEKTGKDKDKGKDKSAGKDKDKSGSKDKKKDADNLDSDKKADDKKPEVEEVVVVKDVVVETAEDEATAEHKTENTEIVVSED